jgi:hypothetical protein
MTVSGQRGSEAPGGRPNRGGVPALPVLMMLTAVFGFGAFQCAAAVGLPHSGGAIGVEVFAGCVVASVVTAALRAVGLVQEGV